jgi:hypothetical protein
VPFYSNVKLTDNGIGLGEVAEPKSQIEKLNGNIAKPLVSCCQF